MTTVETSCESIRSCWDSFHPSVPPLRWFVRELRCREWLRVHSLPQAKRYPESESEQSEVLRRYSGAAAAVFDEEAKVIAVVGATGHPDTDSFIRNMELTKIPGWRDAYANNPRVCEKFGIEDDLDPFTFYVGEVEWVPKRFSELLLRVADDDLDPILFFCPQTGAIFSPYDGGSDLIFASSAARDAAILSLKPWLSDGADGL